MKKLKIWHISDSHTYHDLLEIPECDIVIFSGDCSNPRDPYNNEPEVRAFIHWFKSLPIKHKIFVAGNHDTSIEKGLVKKIDFSGYNIHYLENDYIHLEGLKIFGSPNTPTFGTGWAFNKNRAKLDKHWSQIDDDTDIIVVHGPPKGVLDLSYDRGGNLEHCGCNALKRHILGRIKPKLVCFGHIHCFSSDTEILTSEGWKDINSINDKNTPITFNMDKGLLEKDEIIEIIKSPFKGEVLKLKNKNLDVIVTKNHDLIDFSNKIPFKFKANEIKEKSIRTFKVAGILDQEEYKISDNEIRLMVQCTTDGSYEAGAWRFHLKKKRKITNLLLLLDEMKINYSHHIQSSGNSKIRFKYPFGDFPKPLNKKVLSFSKRQIDLVFKEYYVTNGYKCKEEYSSFQISTSKKEEADLLQALAVFSDRKCSITKRKTSENYTVSINEAKNKTEFITNSMGVETITYDDQIWCLRTKNATIVSRRNGKTLISGNSCQDIVNAGVVKFSAYETIFSNGSIVTDGKFGKLSSNGNIIEL